MCGAVFSLVICFVEVSIAGEGVGGPEWTTILADGSNRTGKIVGFNEGKGLTFRSGQKEEFIPVSNILEMFSAQEGSCLNVDSYVEVVFENNDLLLGSIRQNTITGLRFQSFSFGLFDIKLGLVKSVRFIEEGNSVELLDKFKTVREKSKERNDVDCLVLKNGEVLYGIIEELGPRRVYIGSELGKIDIDSKRIYGVILTSNVEVDSNEDKNVKGILETVSGEVMKVAFSGFESSKLVGLTQCGKVHVKLADMRRIRFINGAMIYLSDIKPESIEQIPFFDVVYPCKLDKSQGGNPMMMNGESYRKGIGVHSGSKITYYLGEKYDKFYCDIGIDDEVGDRGNVAFVVLGDGEELYRSKKVTGADQIIRLVIKIMTVRRLVLLVEFGDEFHIRDHANWGSARVVRKIQ